MIIDRLTTPFIIYKHPNEIYVVGSEFFYKSFKETEYQKRRFYSDEKPVELSEFLKKS